MTGRHETAAVDAMKACANAWAGDDYPLLVRDAAADVLLAGSLVPALIASGHLVLALEDAAQAAEDGAKRIRAALVEAMSLGANSVSLDHHVMSLVEPRPKPVITDPAALPAEFLVPQPPKPDMHAVAKALKSGPVPGASMSNGGVGHIRIAAKKEKAA